jgi:hypothetical protein
LWRVGLKGGKSGTPGVHTPTVLLCATLYFSVLLYTSTVVPYTFTVPLCTSLYLSVLSYTSLYFPILPYTSLYFHILPYTSLYFSIPPCTFSVLSLYLPVLSCTFLYFPIPPCTSLYFPVLPYTSTKGKQQSVILWFKMSFEDLRSFLNHLKSSKLIFSHDLAWFKII